MTKSKPTSFRLTDEAKRLIVEIGRRKGLNQTAVVETAIRLLAKEK